LPEETLLELAQPMFHHRTPEFQAILKQVLSDLQYVLATQNDVADPDQFRHGCDGSGGREYGGSRQKVIVLASGRFGERWSEIARAFGIEPIVLKVPAGESVSPGQLEVAVGADPDAIAVFARFAKRPPVQGMTWRPWGKLVAGTSAILAVDGISGAGAMECRTDAWGIDILVTGSQKALMLPPGLAF